MSAPGGGYQGLGYYDEQPREKKPKGLLLSVVVAAVVAVGLVVTLLVVRPSSPVNGEPLAAALSNDRTSSTPSTTSRSSGGGGLTNNPLQPKATGAPMVAGWKVIPIDNGKELVTTKAYDVPPNWEPLPIAAAFAQQTDYKISVYTPGIYKKGYCPNQPTSFRSLAGVTALANTGDNAAQSIAAAQRVSDAVYANKQGVKPKVAMGQPKQVNVDRTKKGYVVSATLTVTPSADDVNKCAPPTAVVTVMVMESKPEDKNSVVVIAVADQGVPEATPAEDLEKVVTSVHPAN